MNAQVMSRSERLVFVGKRIVLALLTVLYGLLVCLKWTALLVSFMAHHGAEFVARTIAELAGTPEEDVLAWASAKQQRQAPGATSPSFRQTVFVVAEPAGKCAA
ncbi:hypothetical protein ACVDFE_00270 [Lentzea chajnantorensis]